MNTPIEYFRAFKSETYMANPEYMTGYAIAFFGCMLYAAARLFVDAIWNRPEK